MQMTTGLHKSAIPLKQRLIGLSMIIGPIIALVGFLFHPLEQGEGLAKLQLIANNASHWNIAHILFLVSMPFLITAALGLMKLVQGGAEGLALLSAALVLVGAIFFSALFGTELALSAMATVPANQYAGLVPGVEAITSGKGPMFVVMLGVAFNIGLILLAIALYAANPVPRWASAFVGIGALILVTATVTDAYGAASFAVMLVGLGRIGLQLLTQPVEGQ